MKSTAKKTNNKVKKGRTVINDDGMVALNQHKFDVVLADPPWPRGQQGARGASMHYKLMKLEDIKAMPIKEMTTDDAVLFLWTTNGGLEDALEVMHAWGFEYRTNYAWHKTRPGVGVYNRSMHELLLFGVKKPRLPAIKNQPSCNFFPVQEHSHKPEEYYEIIERSYPSDRYLELFARKRTTHKDWYIWGNEAEGGSDVYIPGYPVPKYSDKVKLAKREDMEDGLYGDMGDDFLAPDEPVPTEEPLEESAEHSPEESLEAADAGSPEIPTNDTDTTAERS